jgi:hypothetical protein
MHEGRNAIEVEEFVKPDNLLALRSVHLLSVVCMLLGLELKNRVLSNNFGDN